MSAPSEPATVEDTLAWEAEQRPRAAIAAIAAGLLLLIGSIITGVALSDQPQVTVIEALRDAAGSPPADGGLRTAAALFYHDRTISLTVGQVLFGLGGLLASGALIYLFLATRARKPGMGQAALIALAVGGVAFVVGVVVAQVARDVSLASFAGSSDHGTAAAHDAITPPAYVVGSLFQYLGRLALAVGFLMVALNAMRVGLLTRFMGVLGVLSGLLFLLQVTALPVVQAFWLVALGALFARQWPRAVPPAWTSGKAEPWPSRQEQLEARASASSA